MKSPRPRYDHRTKRANSRVTLLRLETLERRELLATFTVSTTGDSGAGTLRQAIIDSNTAGGTNTINFSITGTGIQSIALLSPLPTVTTPVTINGFSQTSGSTTPQIELNGAGAGAGANGLNITAGNSTVQGLIINRFTGNGIVLSGTGGNAINGDFIGVNQAGTTASANGGDGVFINGSPNNSIGAQTSNGRDIISGNTGSGVHIAGAASITNVVVNDAIGTDLAGAANLANGGDGVRIETGTGNLIGGITTSAPNTIAFNGGAGVNVVSGTGEAIHHNSIFRNIASGIKLGTGANNNNPAPTITVVTTTSGVTTVQGTYKGAANTTYTIEFFSNTEIDPSGFGQGRTFVGSTTVTTNSSGNATFSANTTSAVTLNNFVASTSTDPNGNTSQFSNNGLNTAPIASLKITGTSSPNPVAAGAYLTYTFTISNGGPNNASNTTFIDALPTGFTFVMANASQGSVTQSGGTVTANLNTLAPNATATVTILVVPPTTASGTISTTGTVSAPESPGANVTVPTQVVAGMNLGISTTYSPTPAISGKNVTLQFVVTNTGQATATNVKLTDQLPSTLTFVSTSSSTGQSTQSGGLITASLGSLATGASATVFVVATPTTTGTINNSVFVTGDQVQVQPANLGATQNIVVNAPPAPPGATDGPLVNGLQRFGVHSQQTDIVLTFSVPLNASTATNPANYRLLAFNLLRHRTIPIRTITYDSINRKVTLKLASPLGLHTPVNLTVNGTTSTGVADLNGNLLDGTRSGKPGSNFVWTFSGFGPGVIAS